MLQFDGLSIYFMSSGFLVSEEKNKLQLLDDFIFPFSVWNVQPNVGTLSLWKPEQTMTHGQEISAVL